MIKFGILKSKIEKVLLESYSNDTFKDELKNLNKNKAKIGGFTDNTYWSSTEFSKGYAWVQSFCFGFQVHEFKGDPHHVRLVRAH